MDRKPDDGPSFWPWVVILHILIASLALYKYYQHLGLFGNQP